MEFCGFYYVLSELPDSTDKVGLRVAAYRPHQCDPDKIIAWREYQARLAEIDARLPPAATTRSAWQIKKQKEQEEAWEIALTVVCDVCNATVGEYCTSNAKGPSFGKVLTNPHTPRMEKAENGN
jgi:hypothetical protein